MVARGLHDLGLDVRVVTNTAEQGGLSFPFEVIRKPSFLSARQCLLWSDVVLHSNLTLRLAPPLLMVRRPWVVVHHTWLYPSDAPKTMIARLKEVILRLANCYAVSHALGQSFTNQTGWLPNPYDESTFGIGDSPQAERAGDIIFVGRLVSDKGVSVLVEALSLLHAQGHTAKLTIVGDGPDLPPLQSQVTRLGLESSVVFVGRLAGTKLAECMREHKLIAIPSIWREPFGLVALEGIASGCAVVASNVGGLPDAVGPCGVLVPPGDANAWAEALGRMLADDDSRRECLKAATEHLARHQLRQVCERYAEVLQAAVAREAPL